MTMKKQLRFGFTLVELLVVISIIGMLAGLLLPAVQAAREAGRRAVCLNNQSQLALACINYDSAKQNLPPMRGEIGRKLTATDAGEINITSWIGFILPYMEFNQLYQNLSNVTINGDSASGTYYETQLIRIKSLLCPSAEQPENVNSGTHYVCNGGYQNAIGTSWDTTNITTWTSGDKGRIEPGKIAEAVFLDQLAYSEPSRRCTAKVSIDYISSHSGTSNVLLLSENDRPITGASGARWAYWDGSSSYSSDSITWTYDVMADSEERIAFCYPYNIAVTESGTTGSAITALSTLAEYSTGDKWSYLGYNNIVATANDYAVPAFINAGRGREFDNAWTTNQYHRARPSSNHPGIVLAAFADRSVRPLNENINKQTFVWICQPNSGRVISGDNF
jgi:prepilin-type N-terminal cleavage/methylation domain-containing protein